MHLFTKTALALAVTASLSGCIDSPYSKDSNPIEMDSGYPEVQNNSQSHSSYQKQEDLDKRFYVARATIDGKVLNIPIGVDAQTYINQFILSEKLKESEPDVYNAILEESQIKSQIITSQAASSVFTQKVYSKLTVEEDEVNDLYEEFVKSNDWRNGTVLISKSEKKADMVDFYNKVSAEKSNKKIKKMLKGMSPFIKDEDFYKIPPSLSLLFSKLDKESRYSQPILIQGQWVVFYLKDVKKIPALGLEKVKAVLVERKKQQKLVEKLKDYISPADINLKIN